MNYCDQREDHSQLFAEMAAHTPPILICISLLQCDFAFPPIKRSYLFPSPESQLTCGLLRPLECGQSGGMQILKPRFIKSCRFSPHPLRTLH